jgi:hypothetical protein
VDAADARSPGQALANMEAAVRREMRWCACADVVPGTFRIDAGGKARTVSSRELLAEVWGHRAAVMTRTVDMHVAQLRRKLEEDPAQPRHIVTVWKAGYRLAP